jgi:phospholipid-binding lipoprotein MlaA
LGFFDVTSYEGIPRTKEDFGQTLGHWGAGEGPFLVLPILGPSNVRDTAGFATDTVAFALADPLTLSSMQTDYPAILALNIINRRYTQPFRYYETGSPFEYDLLRFLYTEKRRADIEK